MIDQPAPTDDDPFERVAVFSLATGEIARIVQCHQSQVVLQPSAGQDCIEVDASISDATHYVNTTTRAAVAFPLPPCDHCTWEWSSLSWSDAGALQATQDQAWGSIKSQREAAAEAALSTPFGVFDADKASRDNIIGAVAGLQLAVAAGAPDSITWTLADNTVAPLTLAQLQQVALLLMAQVNGAYDTARALRDQIYAPDATMASVASIAWPSP